MESLVNYNFREDLLGDGLSFIIMERKIHPKAVELLESYGVKVSDRITRSEEGNSWHGYYTALAYKVAQPNAEVYLEPNSAAGYLKVMEIKPNVVSMSMSDINITDEAQKEMAGVSFIIAASGNDGELLEENAASKPWWTAIGACGDKNGLHRRYYSSFGLGAVVAMGIDGFSIQGQNLAGTSFSTPWVGIMIGQYQQEFDIFYERYPSVKETYKFLTDYCIDVGEKGEDLETGFGLFSLPKNYPFTRTNYLKVVDYGLSEEINVPMDNDPTWIIIHHALAKRCSMLDIHEWHLQAGYKGAGYHWLVRKLEPVFEKGRLEFQQGAHTRGKNTESIGICLEGCYTDYANQTEKEVPMLQLSMLAFLVRQLMKKYNITVDRVKFHRDFTDSKDCPGKYFPTEIFYKLLNNSSIIIDKWEREGEATKL